MHRADTHVCAMAMRPAALTHCMCNNVSHDLVLLVHEPGYFLCLRIEPYLWLQLEA